MNHRQALCTFSNDPNENNFMQYFASVKEMGFIIKFVLMFGALFVCNGVILFRLNETVYYYARLCNWILLKVTLCNTTII